MTKVKHNDCQTRSWTSSVFTNETDCGDGMLVYACAITAKGAPIVQTK